LLLNSYQSLGNILEVLQTLQIMKGWNLIGFNFPNYSMIDPSRWKHCVVHPGSRLISKPDELGTLFCPLCGTSYLPKETATEENFQPSASPKTQTKIFTAKSKKKYYDKQGNEINDKHLLKDITNGMNVISYNEVKSGEERLVVKK
jgi:uncharacterized Zn finger protein (UPF0148 family)